MSCERWSANAQDQTTEQNSREYAPKFETSANHPVPVPYSTAASVLIPGLRPIKSALRANKRKLHKLYVAAEGITRIERQALIDKAKALDVPVSIITNKWLDRVVAQLAGPEGATVHDVSLRDLPQPIQ